MDEDLKIVITSELEADEQASAQRIAAQLDDIARLINQKSRIKVQAEVDAHNIQTEAQRFSREMSRAVQAHPVGVSLGLDQASVSRMQRELNALHVNPDISRAMTEQLEKMGIQIDRISGRWEEIEGQENRLLNLTIQGTDQIGRTVSYLQTYDALTGDIETRMHNVTLNLEQQRQAEARIAARARADNESRIAYLTRQQSILSDIQAAYTGATSAKPLQNAEHLEEVNALYGELAQRIHTMIGTAGQLNQVQRAGLEADIAALKQLVKEYQSAEYVATQLRTKDVASVKSDQIAKLDQFEQKLRDAGALTQDFQRGIDHLRVRIASAFDAESITLFLNKFDAIQNRADTIIGQIAQIDRLWQELASVSAKVSEVRQKMVGLDPEQDAVEYGALQRQLDIYQEQEVSIGRQIRSFGKLVDLSQGRVDYDRQAAILAEDMVLTEEELAAKLREIEQAAQRIPSTVQDLETKFRNVVAPTENLIQNMEQLRSAEEAYQSADTDTKKIAAYERLQFLIRECGKEISELTRVQRSDVLGFKFNENLEKAKADLATVGRQWSALKQDPGLNAQFQQLGENLKRVDNQMDLNKWTAQFSRFKSEVKAAGKNMLSLGDVLKNNLSKVLQWVSATTMLFRAFNLMRSAVSIVIELDTAMIDLRKTTTATEAEYRKFYLTANQTAKALGITTAEIISQTAEWSRLGYTMQEAAKLAENSAIFKAISPEMDISTATDGLVSIIKAFGFNVDDTMDGIISKINAVGNSFAVTNSDIVNVLTRSSAAMASANNSFEQTVALATAAIEITRDAESVGKQFAQRYSNVA